MTGLPNTRAALLAIAERRAALLAQELRNEIVETLSQPGTGRIYTQYYAMKNGRLVPVGKRDKPHQASAPGEAPAVDDGQLRQSITALPLAPGHWRVGTVLAYALYLEFGTQRVAARPFIRPAAEKVRQRGSGV